MSRYELAMTFCCLGMTSWQSVEAPCVGARLETRPPVALGSSPELSAFTMSQPRVAAGSPGFPVPHLHHGHYNYPLHLSDP